MKLSEKIDNIRERLVKKYGVHTTAYYPTQYWVRGDGARYKEPNYLKSTKDIFGCLEEMLPTARRIQVRGEFGSDPYDDALVHNKVVYINRGPVVTFATTKILKNTAIWNTR